MSEEPVEPELLEKYLGWTMCKPSHWTRSRSHWRPSQTGVAAMNTAMRSARMTWGAIAVWACLVVIGADAQPIVIQKARRWPR